MPKKVSRHPYSATLHFSRGKSNSIAFIATLPSSRENREAACPLPLLYTLAEEQED